MYFIFAKLTAIIGTLVCYTRAQDCVYCLTVPCQSTIPQATDSIWTSCLSCLQKGYPLQCPSTSTAASCATLLIGSYSGTDSASCCSAITGTLLRGLQPDVWPSCSAPPSSLTPRSPVGVAPLPYVSSNGQPLQYIIPQMNFSCQGCLQMLNITLMGGVSADSSFYLQLWRRYTAISGQSPASSNLYQLNTSVLLTISASSGFSSNVYSLAINVCFHEGDTIGIQLPYNSLLRIATDNSSVIYKRDIPAQCTDVVSGIFQPSLNYIGAPLITLIMAPSSSSPFPTTVMSSVQTAPPPIPPSLTAVSVTTTTTVTTSNTPVAFPIEILSASIGAVVMVLVLVLVLVTIACCCCAYKMRQKNRVKRMSVIGSLPPGGQISANTQEQDEQHGSVHSSESYLSMQPGAGSPVEQGDHDQVACSHSNHLSQSLPSIVEASEEQITHNKEVELMQQSLENMDHLTGVENTDLPTGQSSQEIETVFGGDSSAHGTESQDTPTRHTHRTYSCPANAPAKYFVLESTKKDPRTGHNYHILEGQLSKNKENLTPSPANHTSSPVTAFVTLNRMSCPDSQRNTSEEADHFWEPSSVDAIFYDQIRTKKYRELSGSDILFIEKLGSGEFGTVYRAQWSFVGGKMEVAIKTMTESGRPGAKVAFLQEAAIMGQFFHPNVVKLHGVVTKGIATMIVYELMANKDLATYLTSHFMVSGSQPPSSSLLPLASSPQPPPPSLLLSFCRGVASGMRYLSQKGFVHRDLAARNILVNDSLVCKIGDFGMSRRLEENYYITRKGKIALNWSPPEVFEYGKFSTSSDVYSYGMLLYEIWSCGSRPLANYGPEEVKRLLSKGYCQPPPSWCPREIYRLMVLCWNPSSKDRPSFSDIQSFLDVADKQLLSWSTDDEETVKRYTSCHGALLAEVTELYRDLQQTYCPRGIDGTPAAIAMMV